MTTKFNPENKQKLSARESLGPAMQITDKDDADQYLKSYINYLQGFLDKTPRDDGMTAEQIAKKNIGYFAGYYDEKTRIRVESLFDCEHPIFGKVIL